MHYEVAGIGQQDVVATITGRLVDQMLPKLKEIVARASEAAEPTIRTVVREEIVPKVGLSVVLGLAAMGAIAAAIGSYFATKHYRRNPGRLVYRRRRSA